MALDTLRKGAATNVRFDSRRPPGGKLRCLGYRGHLYGYGRQTLIEVGDTEISPEDYQRVQQEVLRAMSRMLAAPSVYKMREPRVSINASWSGWLVVRP